MAHAEQCPICYGRGTTPGDPGLTAPEYKLCRGCGGKGWVAVDDTIMYPGGIYPNGDPISNPTITWHSPWTAGETHVTQ